MMNSLTTLTGNHWGRIALLGLAALLVAVAALVFSGGGGRIAAQASPGLVIEGVVVSGSEIHAYEGVWSEYTVRLATKPTADVTVTLKPHNDSSKSIHVRWTSGGKTATFTPSNWDTPQTVYVWGNHDNDYQNINGQWVARVVDGVDWVYHIADSDDSDYFLQEVYKGRVTDDDGLSLSASPLTVTEGGSATYKVNLLTKPTGNVSVSFAVAGDESISVSPSSLTFDANNYQREQTVTVSAAPDSDTANGTATITQTANGANYSYHRVRLAVTESDTGVGTPPATATPTPTPAPVASVSLVVTTPAECDMDTLDRNDNPIDGMKVAQGETCTFDVKLGKKPNADVPVHVYKYGDADGVLSYSPGKLTFTASNWDTAQTVTVTSAATQYHGLRQANLLIRTGSTKDTTGYHNLPWTYLRVNQVKGAGILTTGPGLTHRGGNSAVSVTEGSSVSYDLKLNTKPTANVTITIAHPTSGDADLTLVGAKNNQVVRTFTPSNWNTNQLVTIAAAHDVDLVNGSAIFVHTAASDDADYNGKVTDVTATEVEDDEASLVLSSNAVTVPEGGSASYSVKLSNQPNAGVNVFLNWNQSQDTDITTNLSPQVLSFTTSNWNVAQTVTLRAAEDGDDLRTTHTLNHRAAGAEFDGLEVNLTATEGENDRRGFVVTPGGPVNMDEGGTHTYTIKLGTEPTADVVVALNVEGDSDITVSPASLTFTSSNYATAQTVTITAAADNTDYADDTAYISHAVTTTDAIYVEQFIPTIYVTAKDDDAALMLSTNTLQVAEGGTAEYTVKLTNAPTGDVTVTLAEGTTSNDDTSITVSSPLGKKLTFTTSNWNTAQTVTLSAANDTDAINGTRSISHTASGGGFDSAPMYSLTAIESDSAAAVIIRNSADTGNVSSINVVEGGDGGTYKVKLGAQPAADVTVALSVTGDSDITVNPATLTFTSGNWDTAQTVTVSAASDADLANGTAVVSHAASDSNTTNGSGYNGLTASLNVTESDNTGQVVVQDTSGNAITTITVPENGNTTYEVKLGHLPTGNVIVRLPYASGGDTSISRSPSALYFTTQNWSTAQTVTVRASNDSDTVAGTRNIIHTASGGGYNSIATSKTLTATEVEDDYAIVLRNAADSAGISTLSVTEGSTASYKVKLSVAPVGSVTVDIAAATGGDSDITVSPASLTFTAQNYGTAQDVTLTAAEDNTDIVNGTATFTHTASGGGYGNTPVASLTATEADNDTGTIVLSATTASVPEAGSTTYTVKLSHQPRGNVTVSLGYASGGDSDITYNKSNLYFNATNWDTLQTVTLRARDDNDQANGSRTINHTSSGGGYTATAALAATEVENDKAIILSESAVSVGEGSTASYTVKLSVAPTADVTVTIAAATTGNAIDPSITVKDTDDSTNGDQLTDIVFTSSNWSTARTVVLAAAEDTDLTNGSRAITHTATSTDTGYSGVTASLTATEADNDSDGAIKLRNSADSADITAMSVPEGSSATYKVKLSKQPRGNVVVTVAGSDGVSADTDITVSPLSLTFTPNNWSTAKTVTLRAAQDNADLTNGSRTITHTAATANTGYSALIASLSATEADNDNNGQILVRNSGDSAAITTLDVTEGSTATYKVKLDKQPRADVVVTIAEATTGNATDSNITVTTPSNKTLTFTANNWSTAQTVTLTAAEDDDLTNGSRAITHTAANADTGYSGASVKSLTATEADNDNDGAILVRNAADDDAITTLGVREGGTASYKVKLEKQPRGNVTVALTYESGGDTDITASPTTLSFNTSNWNTAKTVTLRAAQDIGMGFGSRTIEHTASGAGSGYSSSTVVDLTAQEWEDDVMIQLEDTSGNDTDAMNIPEGSSSHYKVSLSAMPLGNVTVTLSSSGGDNDIKFDADTQLPGYQSTLTLTPTTQGNTGNWDTGVQVAVSAAPDADGSNGSKTIRHTASGGGYDYAATANLAIREVDGPSLYVNPDTITATTAVLRVYNHTGNWYYKANAQNAPCSAVQTSSTDTVTGLSKSSNYSYRAYTDATCTDANALTPFAAFSTKAPSLVQSNVLATTATLTLERWDLTKDGNWYYKSNTGLHTTCSSAQTALTVNFTGLTKNTSYLYTAYSDSGCTAEIAATSTFSTLNTALVQSGTGTTVTLTLSGWSIADNGNWYYKAITGDSPHTSCSSAQSSLTANVTGLTTSTAYTFGAYSDSACTTANVQATTASFTPSGGGNQIQQQQYQQQEEQQQGQQEQDPQDPPGGVSGLTVGRAGGTITASWDAASGATGYDVVYSSDGKNSWTRGATKQSGTSYTLSGADASKDYVIAVRAVNSVGASGWTNSETALAETPPPGGVASVSATHNGGSVSVSWDAATDATGYDVVYSTDGLNSWTRAATNQSGTSYTLDNADSSKSYVFSVRAVNDAGASGWSNSAPAEPPGAGAD